MAFPKTDVLRSSPSCGNDRIAFLFFRFPVSLLGWYALEIHLKLYLFFRHRYIIPHTDPHYPRLCMTPHDLHVTYSLRTIFLTY